MSLEQAKAIKEKRELAQELGTWQFLRSVIPALAKETHKHPADVTEFAAKIEARGGKSKSGESDTGINEDKNGASEEEEEEIQAPRKRMVRSVMRSTNPPN